MAKENMQLGEKFATQVVKSANAGSDLPGVKPRHLVIGYGLIAMILGALGWWFTNTHKIPEKIIDERPGFMEHLGTKGAKLGGVLYYDIIRASINIPKEWDIAAQVGGLLTGHLRYEQTHFGPIPNLIVNEGETALRDCFGGTGTPTCTDTQNFKFHGLGTSAIAAAETDGGCTTELTTQYNPDNTRATGTQTNNGLNIYRTLGTNTVDAAATINEFCLMAVNTGAGNMWTRILTGSIALSAADGLQTTYDLTIE